MTSGVTVRVGWLSAAAAAALRHTKSVVIAPTNAHESINPLLGFTKFAEPFNSDVRDQTVNVSSAVNVGHENLNLDVPSAATETPRPVGASKLN